MFLKKLRGVRIVSRERCDGRDCEKQPESHPVPRSGARWLRPGVYQQSLFPDHMSDVFFVLGADILPDVVVGIQFRRSRDFPGLRISSRIVDRELDFEMSQIGPAKALDDAHHFGVRMTLRYRARIGRRSPRCRPPACRLPNVRSNVPSTSDSDPWDGRVHLRKPGDGSGCHPRRASPAGWAFEPVCRETKLPRW